jgi:hypothetical protein
MRLRVLRSSVLLAGLAFAAPALIAGQPLPAGPVSRISPPAQSAFPGSTGDGQVCATAFSGGFAVGWQRYQAWDDENQDPWKTQYWQSSVRLVTPSGQPHATLGLWGPACCETEPGPARLAPAADGGLVAAWWQGRDDGVDVWVQILDADGTPRTAPDVQGRRPPGPGSLLGPLVASHPTAGFVVAWSEDNGSFGMEMKVHGFHPSGTPAAPIRVLPPITPGWRPQVEALLIDPTGHFFLVWQEYPFREAGVAFWGRRFALDGTPTGLPRRLPGTHLIARRDGGFVLAVPDPAGLRLLRYTRAGNPTGLAATVPLAAGEQLAASAADSRGDLALLLRRPDHHLFLLLVNRDLVAQGAPVEIGITWPPSGWEYDTGGAVAFGADDSLFAAWAGPPEIHTPPGVTLLAIWSRLFRPCRDADPCVYQGNRFLCDTAGDGGAAEVALPFGTDALDQPLLGDWDGDGRADLCLAHDGRTLCDTGHDGGAAEVRSPRFKVAGEPLLGDVDGDGKAEPCRFAVRKRFGRDFACDVRRDGGTAELTLPFGQIGDKPVLGDVDGDGRDDPCVLRAGRLLCDTAHDGVAGEVRMNLRAAFGDAAVEGTPVLGDLNGDGRADPCVVWGGTFLCGLYGPQGGLPRQVFALPFGPSDAVPLLGDVDDF